MFLFNKMAREPREKGKTVVFNRFTLQERVTRMYHQRKQKETEKEQKKLEKYEKKMVN